MTERLGLTGEDKIKNVMFFTDSQAEVQKEIEFLIQKLERRELRFTDSVDSYSRLTFSERAYALAGSSLEAIKAPAIEAVAHIVSKHTGIPPITVERIIRGGASSSGGCFHSQSLVNMRNGKTIAMHALQIGDEVLVFNPKNGLVGWDRINNFIHRDHDFIADFLKIQTISCVL